ncbi:hypothetical protein QBC38DRAFT_525734 [Podospora fimiseda]|uniref:Orc1-like AAA ATPase domain-containing protein n=1 Tax=Podospora fimiseda TaxID=252190 RepID=A0AAN7BYH1_9PEZI|nr:hypothetical protein QBC38DRAFT_525734 [Podospora fimiseda]
MTTTEATINKNPSRYELTTVYSHPLAKADIVLVHGLNGDPLKTWASLKNGVFWPTDLLPAALKTEHANVLVYGYNADVYSTKRDRSPSDNFIHQHAQSLVTSLTQYRKSSGTDRLPLIWVAHSLGGILAKRALLYSNDVRAHHHEDFRSIFVSTYGIIFLGTPHNGSDLAIWGRVLQLMSDITMPRKLFETQPTLLRALKKDNETLQGINSHFLDVYQRFRIHMVHENHRTDVRGSKVLVVDAASAGPQLPGVTYYGIEASHSGMCKFESEKAPGWVNVSTALREWVGDGGDVIPIRWEVEEEDRRTRANLENFERRRGYLLVGFSLFKNHSQLEVVIIATVPVLLGTASHLLRSRKQKAMRRNMWQIDNPDGNNAMSISRQRSLVGPAMIASASPPSLLIESMPPSEHSQGPPESEQEAAVKPSRLLKSREESEQQPLFIHPEPFRPNSFFIGREDELRGLHEMLMDRKRRSEGTSAVLIQCLPGGGKTHLARQYVFQHMDDYPGGVYWVRAKSKPEMEYWFWRIAKNEALRDLFPEQQQQQQQNNPEVDDKPHNPQKIVQTVRRWLNTQPDWLIVFDGVQFDTPGLLEFIPDARNTSMIYTSTERSVTGDPRFDNPRVMELGLLTPNQATDLLLLEMDKKLPWSQDDRVKALALVQLMGRLPLMIHVAAQHLKATREPLSRYLASYRSRPKAGSLLAYKAVRDQLENRGETAALNLISLIVFFDQHVPVEMISLGIPALDKITPVKTRDAAHLKTTLNNTLKTLIAFALVERSESDEEVNYSGSGGVSSYSVSTRYSLDHSRENNRRYIDLLRIHSVVQAFFIESLHRDRQIPFWLERATAIWCRSFDEAERRVEERGVGLTDDYRRYGIHGEKLLGNMKRFERRYYGCGGLGKVRGMLQERLGRIEKRVEELSGIEREEERGRSSVFDRVVGRCGGGGSSTSQSDESGTCGRGSQNSWEADLMTLGVEDLRGGGGGFWEGGGVPYPVSPGGLGLLMPGLPVENDQETVVPEPKGQYFDDRKQDIPPVRPALRAEHGQVGSWRDKTVGDPRVSLSQEVAVGSLSTPRKAEPPEFMLPIPPRKRITARSDAELELNKIKMATVSFPTSPPIPPTETITTTATKWTFLILFRKLKDLILPTDTSSQPKDNYSLPLPPAAAAAVPSSPSPIFRGSRSANSSPDHSPIPIPIIRRWETTNTHNNPTNLLLRVDSSSVDNNTGILSRSFPTPNTSIPHNNRRGSRIPRGSRTTLSRNHNNHRLSSSPSPQQKHHHRGTYSSAGTQTPTSTKTHPGIKLDDGTIIEFGSGSSQQGDHVTGKRGLFVDWYGDGDDEEMQGGRRRSAPEVSGGRDDDRGDVMGLGII